MPEQIYHKSESHYDDEDLIPEFGVGVDEHSFVVPAGRKLVNYQLEINNSTMGSLAAVVAAPPNGAQGPQKIKVQWNHNPFGKIAYTLKVFAAENDDTAIIAVGPTNPTAPTQARQAFSDRKPFTLVVTGPDALAATNAFRKAKNLSPLNNQVSYVTAVTPAEVTIVALIVAMAVTMATLTVIALICVVAIANEYNVDIDYQRKGPLPFDDRLEIRLRPKVA